MNKLQTACVTLFALACLAWPTATARAASAPAPDTGWPRIIVSGGATNTLYQPQLDSWDGFTLKARMVVSMHAPDLVRVRNYRPWKSVEDEGKALELWAIPKEGAPRSLGVVPNVPGDMTLKIRMDDERLKGATMLALSVEPKGGSPTQLPTGRVLCSGAVAAAQRKT